MFNRSSDFGRYKQLQLTRSYLNIRGVLLNFWGDLPWGYACGAAGPTDRGRWTRRITRRIISPIPMLAHDSPAVIKSALRTSKLGHPPQGTGGNRDRDFISVASGTNGVFVTTGYPD